MDFSRITYDSELVEIVNSACEWVQDKETEPEILVRACLQGESIQEMVNRLFLTLASIWGDMVDE